ncbi:type VI secretion system TssO [Spirosoma sp.]|uniref:type VI secretion system TssO n=1 Tax=Spirosoma sp. TaxID=1899569 RepID=UPI00261E90ED|nr:type VI secretion system TssO [Spirosoma sp.]MCX6218234.1 type VI secretion system TssO [Spirosoma sp.]
METFFRLTMRERRLQFMYLLAVLCLLTLFVSFIAFKSNTYSSAESKRVSSKIKQQEQILKSQIRNMPLLDSAYQSIVAFQPQVNAVFVEVEIEEHLNEIKRLSNPQMDNTRFRSFGQIADFYRMMYIDKKIVWSKQSNISLFRKQLDDCSVGLISNATSTPGPSASPQPNPGDQ